MIDALSTNLFAQLPFPAIAFLAAAIVWSLVWKGIALWQSAQARHMWWFIIFLLVNTVGILEIIYIYLILPRKREHSGKSSV